MREIEQYWLEWSVKKEDDCLLSSDFKLVKLSETKVLIPLIWFKDLANKYSELSILRSSNHIPEYPYELVEFIKSLK
jgi:hypothetical protein